MANEAIVTQTSEPAAFLMKDRPSVVERAFQISKSGIVANMDELHARLTAEGYSDNAQYLAGRSILKQLKLLIATAP
jgi:hypothetical protein